MNSVCKAIAPGGDDHRGGAPTARELTVIREALRLNPGRSVNRRGMPIGETRRETVEMKARRILARSKIASVKAAARRDN